MSAGATENANMESMEEEMDAPETRQAGLVVGGIEVVLLRSANGAGALVAQALSQEGIGFTELSLDEVEQLDEMPAARVALVVGPSTPQQRTALRGWVDRGGAVMLLGCEEWSDAELSAWFDLKPTTQKSFGGYLWPQSGVMTLPALEGSRPLQLSGWRTVYTAGKDVQVLALGSSNPTAAIAFDATRDGFADDEWFFCGSWLSRYSRGRSLLEKFSVPGLGEFAPTTAAAGDFSGDGYVDDLLVASGDTYAIMLSGVWTHRGSAGAPIRHAVSYRVPTQPIWPITLFLEDGSVYITSYDGGATFGPRTPFAPAGAPIPTDFSLSLDYVDGAGVLRSALNVFSQGSFYLGDLDAFHPTPIVPNLGPRYIGANVVRPTLGYTADRQRKGLRSDITLLVHSNIYEQDPASDNFNYPYAMYEMHQVHKDPLVIQKGKAVALLFDFEATVLRLQQGDPITPALLEYLRYLTSIGQPALPFTPICNAFDNFVDYTLHELPQADLHERLLREVVLSLVPAPLPRLWYLPHGYRSVSSISYDVETAGEGQTATVRDTTLELGRIGQEAGRHDTFFVLEEVQPILTVPDVARLTEGNHTVSYHFDSFRSANFTPENLKQQVDTIRALGVKRPAANRNHGLMWMLGWMPIALETQPEVIVDSSYGGGPGYSHCGSVLPYRLRSLDDNRAFSSFVEVPHGLMDIADGEFYFNSIVNEGRTVLTVGELFTRARDMAIANDELFYGVFDTLFHPVVVAGLTPPLPHFIDSVREYVQFLKEKQIPFMDLQEVAAWWMLRDGIRLGAMTWSGEQLEFTLDVPEPVTGATLLFPATFHERNLDKVRLNGGTELPGKDTVLDGRSCRLVVLPQVVGKLNIQATYQ